MIERLWTPDHHTHIWAFPKILYTEYVCVCCSIKISLQWNDNAPVHQEVQEDMKCQGWSGRTWTTSILLNTFGMIWNADCTSGLFTSVPNLTNAVVAEWAQTFTAMRQNLVESPRMGMATYYSS